MSRKFFVGGNFKLNPVTREGKKSLINILNNADIDPSVGTSSFNPIPSKNDYTDNCIFAVI